MSHGTPQDVYASNLLRAHHFGYPLRNPKPNNKSDEGCRIGDVGYVGNHGDFTRVCNLFESYKELQEPPHQSTRKVFPAETVFMAGAERNMENPRYFTSLKTLITSLTWHLKGHLRIQNDFQRRCHTHPPGGR